MFAEASPSIGSPVRDLFRAIGRILPGLLACAGIAVASYLAQVGEVFLLGRSWIDAPVLALLLASGARLLRRPAPSLNRGVFFCTHTVLEIAIVLLGGTLGAAAIAAAGPLLFVGIAAAVAVSIAASYCFGLAFGLTRESAILVACGNSICGNSAIMAVAPIVGARESEIAGAVAFTALTGMLVVLLLPLIGGLLAIGGAEYGLLAGLTVYAVPQVLAATSPLGVLAIEVGTIVKLARVAMLAPVTLALSLLAPQFRSGIESGRRRSFRTALPWFVLGFLAMAGLRSAGMISEPAVPVLGETSKFLTVMALAGLGLSVDLRAALRAGPRLMATALVSIAFLALLSVLLIAFVGF